MKKLFSMFVLLIISLSFDVMAANRTVSLKVRNMTCPVCPLTVKKALQKVDGVKQVEIDYRSKTAIVQFDDAITGIDKLIAATTEAGYSAAIEKQ